MDRNREIKSRQEHRMTKRERHGGQRQRGVDRARERGWKRTEIKLDRRG